MGVVDKIKSLGGQVEHEARVTALNILKMLVILFSGLLIGLTFALIGQVIFDYGQFLLTFVTIITLGLIYKLLVQWSISQILLFDLITVLIATLFRMYIFIAP